MNEMCDENLNRGRWCLIMVIGDCLMLTCQLQISGAGNLLQVRFGRLASF